MSAQQLGGLGAIAAVIISLWILSVVYCDGFAAIFPEIFPGGESVACKIVPR